MRPKYIVRDKKDTEFVIGIRYDVVRERFMIGGPQRFMPEITTVIDAYFGGVKVRHIKDASRIRCVGKMEVWVWRDGVRELKEDYLVEKVHRFGRLVG